MLGEAWKLTKTEAKKLDAFQYKCMKRILRIRWPRTISHQQIQETTGVNRTSDEIRRRRWNWIGHILRKNREEHCVTALEWRPEGRRRPSRPKTTWRRMVEDERRVAGWQLWTTVRALAANRRGWKENVKAYSMCLTARRDIESLIFIWQMIALSVGKLKLNYFRRQAKTFLWKVWINSDV